jgi:hypothetical protein
MAKNMKPTALTQKEFSAVSKENYLSEPECRKKLKE